MNAGKRPIQVLMLAALLGLESLVLGVASVFLAVELVVDVPASYPSAVALLVLAVIATVWLVALLVHVLRGAAWTRAGIVVWQVLQLAIAVGLFQGETARPDIAWAILVPSVAALALVFSTPVRAATFRRD